MKKIEAILKGLIDDIKVKNKVRRVELAIQAAELNFNTTKDEGNLLIDSILEKLNDNSNKVEDVISELSSTLDSIEEAEMGLKRIEKIRELIFADVDSKE